MSQTSLPKEGKDRERSQHEPDDTLRKYQPMPAVFDFYKPASIKEQACFMRFPKEVVREVREMYLKSQQAQTSTTTD